MPNGNALKLVNALNSGAYDQCPAALHIVEEEHHTYCCLGVACELYQDEVGDLKVKKHGGHFFYSEDNGKSYNAWLPPKVQKWLGFKDDVGSMNSELSLATLNDKGTPFPAIADIIHSGLCDAE